LLSQAEARRCHSFAFPISFFFRTGCENMLLSSRSLNYQCFRKRTKQTARPSPLQRSEHRQCQGPLRAASPFEPPQWVTQRATGLMGFSSQHPLAAPGQNDFSFVSKIPATCQELSPKTDGHRANCRLTFLSQCSCIFPADRGDGDWGHTHDARTGYGLTKGLCPCPLFTARSNRNLSKSHMKAVWEDAPGAGHRGAGAALCSAPSRGAV